MNKACFIDRDGVLIRELDYLSDPERIEVLPGAAEAVRLLRRSGYLAIVTTNQSGVARGYFDEDAVHAVHRGVDESLGPDAVDGWYYCPHHVEGVHSRLAVDCDCRKPKPGMLLRAARDFNVDLTESFLVGDKITDLLAGLNAGCRSVVLVRTGYGIEQMRQGLPEGAVVRDDLRSAVEWFLEGRIPTEAAYQSKDSKT